MNRVPEATSTQQEGPLLELADVNASYGGGNPLVLSGVNLSVRPGEIVGVVGETGSGKSTLARSVVGMVKPRSGRIVFEGQDIAQLRGRRRRAFQRSGRVQFAFQDPLRALDPDLTVREIVEEPLAVNGIDRRTRTQRAEEALRSVALDEQVLSKTPGRLSGGQRQRVLLARSIITRPRLLLADEPVSALDASTRNHVLNLLDRLRHELGMAIVVISHDLGSLAAVADRVAVLYRGKVVEHGPVNSVLDEPLHPYTALLAAAAPTIGSSARPISPLLIDAGTQREASDGCVYTARCPFSTDVCHAHPSTVQHGEERTVACHHALEWREKARSASHQPVAG